MYTMSPSSTLLTPAPPNIVVEVHTPEEARMLPKGTLVGDQHGGLTFSNAVARILEQRSATGWTEYPPGDPARSWTVIHLDR